MSEARPRAPLPLRALRRLWSLRREPHPWSALLALASQRGDLAPAFLLSQCYLAWQAAFVPRWDAAAQVHALEFHPTLLVARVWSAVRALLPGGETVFHEVRPSGPPPADAPEVLHAIPSLQIGGTEKIVLDIIEGLGQRYRMRVLTGRVVRHARYGGLDLGVVEGVDALVEDLRRRPPALIHLHYWGPNPWMSDFLTALGRSGLKVPVIGNMNNPIPPLAHPSISHHAFVSRFAAAIEPRVSGPSSVIYPGASPRAWAPAPEPERAASPFPVAGLVYRLSPEKLDLGSIDALIAICAARPTVRVLVPGGGELLPEFVRRVRAAGVRANFHFLGWVPFRDLPALYDRLDLFLAPVKAESFGVVVPYAMFKGVPVLAYAVDALPEILADPRWLSATPEEFVARAVAMLDAREESRRDAAALRTAADRFTLDAMLSAYDALYRRLLG